MAPPRPLRPRPLGRVRPPGLTSGPLQQWMKNTATKFVLRLHLCCCACAHSRLAPQTGHNGPRAAPWTGSGREVSRGAPGLAERRQFLPLPPPSAIAEAFQRRHVRQRRLRTGPERQGIEGLSTLRVARQQRGLALPGPTLLLGNWPSNPARALGRRGSLTCGPCPVARKRPVVFESPAPSLAYWVGCGC